MQRLGAAFLFMLLGLSACRSPQESSLPGAQPDATHLRAWKAAAGSQPSDTPDIVGLPLTYPVGTRTAIAAQTDTLNLSNSALLADVQNILRRSYAGPPPPSAQVRAFITVGSVVLNGCSPPKGRMLALPEFLSPRGAPRQQVLGTALPGTAAVCSGGPAGEDYSLEMSNATPALNTWTRVAEQQNGAWTHRVWVYASDQPLLGQRGVFPEVLVTDVRAGRPVRIGDVALPPVPGF